MSNEACPKCGVELRIGDFPFCKGSSLDHDRTRPRGSFTPFEIEIDGATVRIESLQQADRIERESMKLFRDHDDKGDRRGAPHVFRVFHQDHSNMDRGVFDGYYKQPQFQTHTRAGVPITVHRGKR